MQPYEQLELELGKWIGNPNVVVCSSGTAALHLALESLKRTKGFKDRNEIIIPDYTMISCARAVSLAGLTPVPVDCMDNLLINPDIVASVINGKTLGIMAVHIYGRQCNMKALSEIARDRELWMIEDMAEIHGLNPHPMTDAACWSFYANKVVHGEEGGAIAFKSGDCGSRSARMLRSVGFTDTHNYTHIPRGHNYRLANCLASLILDSLSKFGENIRKRMEVEKWYDDSCPKEWRMPLRYSPWVYDLSIPGMNEHTQYRVVHALLSSGVQARYGFKRVSSQEEYRIAGRECTKAEKASREVIYLPLNPGQDTSKSAAWIFDAIRAEMRS
jgi:dTDP-4-amino-4,6-dideoxygalactose transaminase